MKLETLSSSVEISTTMKMDSIKAELAGDKLHKMWDLLQSPYRDPISSLIREYVSNCFDSHIEAGVSTPVYVAMDEDQSGTFWLCEDFGVGISPERAKNIFMKYLSSTKEETNEQIGAFGMGSKSGLGYTDVVHIRTRFDGTEYQYMLHKTSDAPTLSLVSTCETDKRNGTQIKIYLKDSYDEKNSFKAKTQVQLAYFDNIVYGKQLDHLNKDFIIYDQDTFVYNPNSQRNQAHILIGNVVYPINWETVGESRLKDIPIGLKFSIGELPVIFTREDIRYSDAALKLIKDRMLEAELEIANLVFPEELKYTDFLEYVKALRGNIEYVFSEDHVLSLPGFKADSRIVYTPNPHFSTKFIEGLKSKYSSVISSLYSSGYPIYRVIKGGKNYATSYTQYIDPLKNYYVEYVYMDAASDPRTNRYIDWKVTKRDLNCLRDFTMPSDDVIAGALLINKADPNMDFHREWYRTLMEESFESLYTYKYSDLIAMVPDSFEKDLSGKSKAVVLDSDEVRAKVYRQVDVNKWGGSAGPEVTGDLKAIKIKDLKTSTIIWAERGKDLDCTFTKRVLLNFNEKVKVISVASRDVELLKSLSQENANLVYIDDWYSNPNPIIDCLLFVNRYKSLWDLWLGQSTYLKPGKIPYSHITSKSSSYLLSNLNEEYFSHLEEVYKIHGKKLDMTHMSALTSWYKRETQLNTFIEHFDYKCSREVLYAFILGGGKIQMPLAKAKNRNFEQLLLQYYGKTI